MQIRTADEEAVGGGACPGLGRRGRRHTISSAEDTAGAGQSCRLPRVPFVPPDQRARAPAAIRFAGAGRVLGTGRWPAGSQRLTITAATTANTAATAKPIPIASVKAELAACTTCAPVS